jgi:glyoxylase-like metal-dependent hydrolase (beta-lactamase superfamily II)
MGPESDRFERLTDLDDAWAVQSRGPQLRAVRVRAERLRERFLRGPRCVSVRTLPLSTLAYPTRYAFWATAIAPAPFVMMTHRCLLVQFFQDGALKNLLFNPTDVEGAKATPFFARLIEAIGTRMTDVLAGKFDTIEAQLARLGLGAEDIDYVAFDHFHTQDLRGLLGTDDGSRLPRFPNAKLLAPKSEWDDWDDLHPVQRAWFVRDGKLGARTERVVFTTGDMALGDGVMLIRTPGHTSGNQTLFVNTESGVWGVSENGVCADNWSPLESRIKGLAFSCKKQDLDVVLNSNTPEYGALQYTSMILERTLVDRVRRAPAFVQMFPSSEVTPSLLAPGLAPTLLHRAITHGEVGRSRAGASRASIGTEPGGARAPRRVSP